MDSGDQNLCCLVLDDPRNHPENVSMRAQIYFQQPNVQLFRTPYTLRSGLVRWPPTHTTSKRFANAKNEKFAGYIHKRGSVVLGGNRASKYPVGPLMLGFFLFVVVGSAIFQIIRQASAGQAGMMG